MWKALRQALSIAGLYWSINNGIDKEKKDDAMNEFDDAMNKAKDKEKPSTLGVEEWFKKYRR